MTFPWANLFTGFLTVLKKRRNGEPHQQKKYAHSLFFCLQEWLFTCLKFKFWEILSTQHPSKATFIHKPCGQIFGHFHPQLSPLWAILSNKAYVVIWTFGKPPSPCHVYNGLWMAPKVCGTWPMSKHFLGVELPSIKFTALYYIV